MKSLMGALEILNGTFVFFRGGTVLKVPRFLRLPVLASFFWEYLRSLTLPSLFQDFAPCEHYLDHVSVMQFFSENDLNGSGRPRDSRKRNCARSPA